MWKILSFVEHPRAVTAPPGIQITLHMILNSSIVNNTEPVRNMGYGLNKVVQWFLYSI